MNQNHDDDYLLYLAMQSDNKEAYSELFRKHSALLYSLAFFYLKDSEESKDMVQQVFLKFWEGRHSSAVMTNVKNYLFTMVKNSVLNNIRNHTHHLAKNYELYRQKTQLADDLDEKVYDKEQYQILLDAIFKLPTSQRQVCMLKLTDDLSLKEIAERMHLSHNTVKTHYKLALRNLRQFISPHIFALILLFIFK